MKIGVSEIFESIQGEGPSMGRHAVFLRLAGCNLLCGGSGTDKDKRLHDGATWRCDTIEVWQNSNLMELEDLKKEIFNEMHADPLSTGCHLIITGGEPLLWDRQLVALIRSIPESNLPYIEIETNGTLLPSAELDKTVNQYNVSPKLSNSGMPEDRRINPDALKFFSENPKACFKFVLSDLSDMTEVDELRDRYEIYSYRIWLMPSASSREELIEKSELIAELCKDNKMNFSSRLQLQIWDKATGV